ncbi:MAG: saccharopine dehydrogenase NADP-binding domain-containing protein [Bacteroidetes bacterium]|nr:saccharopine dehydrogenase NADP-binding domain-containing protein [Bacteroidota bacterium]MDA1335812.1 saccharopine dehydrogenase NADP-binding domain-containing protein [Bacteroidota bacterium]
MEGKHKILILGAGRSSSSLISELLNRSEANHWQVFVGDVDLDTARVKCGDHPSAVPFRIDPQDATERNEHIASSDLVISMLPAFLHPEIARVAIDAGVSVITPSYLSEEMSALHEDAIRADVLVLNEIGLDPGIDHLSAKLIMDRIESEGGVIEEFESYCGGLIAPESDDNPWHYKFSWNPRNVVLAGQGGAATFLSGGKTRLVPPHRTFQNPTLIEVDGLEFEGYPNRDSISYESIYGLKGVKTLIRGTLRGKGYCAGWDSLIQLGCVRDDVSLNWPSGISWADWMRTFIPSELMNLTIRDGLRELLSLDAPTLDRLEWLGLFDETSGPKKLQGTPAQILQSLLEERWKLQPNDRDMIVMWHRFNYLLKGERHEIISSFRLEGRDAVYTGMSDTVGWPIAIAAEAFMQGRFSQRGVCIPLEESFYSVIMPKLEAMGIRFSESHRICC